MIDFIKLIEEGKSIREISRLTGLSRTAAWARCYPEKAREAQKKRRRNFKRELIDLRGAKCQVCGYDRCLPALDFHHIDKTNKSFSISDGFRLRGNKKLVLAEIKKCVLLCSNCHHEVHEGMVSLRGIEPRPTE